MKNRKKNNACRAAVMLVGASWIATASAQSDNPWDGLYAGVNLGGTENATCANAALNATPTDAAGGLKFAACPSSGFVGGVQVGENFQTRRLVWGLGADLDITSTKRTSEVLKSASGLLPYSTPVITSVRLGGPQVGALRSA